MRSFGANADYILQVTNFATVLAIILLRCRTLPNANGRYRTQTVAAVRCQSLPNAADIDKENK